MTAPDDANIFFLSKQFQMAWKRFLLRFPWQRFRQPGVLDVNRLFGRTIPKSSSASVPWAPVNLPLKAITGHDLHHSICVTASTQSKKECNTPNKIDEILLAQNINVRDFLDDAGNQVQAATAVYDGHNHNQQQQTNPKDQPIIDLLNHLPLQITDESNIINLFQPLALSNCFGFD